MKLLLVYIVGALLVWLDFQFMHNVGLLDLLVKYSAGFLLAYIVFGNKAQRA
jgi:hypothetical protein